jgi:hypothetical protein
LNTQLQIAFALSTLSVVWLLCSLFRMKARIVAVENAVRANMEALSSIGKMVNLIAIHLGKVKP